MKVLIDTNVILDVALERVPHFAFSSAVLGLVESGRIEGYVSAAIFADLYYVIRKDRGRSKALDFLRRIQRICCILPVDDRAIASALASALRDFEDAIQVEVAIAHGMDAIATRNGRDFAPSPCRAIAPDALAAAFPEPESGGPNPAAP